jgi:hypothetical protein
VGGFSDSGVLSATRLAKVADSECRLGDNRPTGVAGGGRISVSGMEIPPLTISTQCPHLRSLSMRLDKMNG